MRPNGYGWKWIAILSLALLPAVSTPAQTTSVSSASSPQAVALATSAMAALTGNVQVNDVTLIGTATRTAGSDIETGTITLKALGTADSRMDFVSSDGTRSEIRNSAGGVPQGSWIGPDGASHAMAGHNCLTDAAWFFPTLTILSQASNPSVVVQYIGQETRNGASVQHLRFTQPPSATTDPTGLLASLSTEDVYLDSASLLPASILFNTHPDANANINIAVEMDFSDYQASNGVMVPFSIHELLNGSLFLDITIQSASVNSGLPASEFTTQ
jgi:hypothetical protein